jgi:acetyl-CoA carboxylase carboxyl transferase subunit alpha
LTSPANGAPAHTLDFEKPILELEKKIDELVTFARSTETDLSGEIAELRQRAAELVREIHAALTPWQRIQIARHPLRPTFSDYLQAFVEDWVELHGDRYFKDDRAIATGFGRIRPADGPAAPGGAARGRKVLLVAHKKGKTTKERVACNFGMPHPEGYRKALRKMRLAEKLGIPIVCMINTPGAYCGVGAEERGQAHAIAENLMAMARLRVPVVCLVIGEGGSGGALGIGVGDRVLMLENAYYSVITPEGCAAILWKTAEKAPQAAEILRITARDLLEFGVVDGIVAEPPGGAHRDPAEACRLVRAAIVASLEQLEGIPSERLLAERYEKLRRIGAWIEGQPIEPGLDEEIADAVEIVSDAPEAASEAAARRERDSSPLRSS